MKINYNIIVGCLIISIGICINGYISNPNSNKNLNDESNITSGIKDKNVLNLTDVMEYLNMTEAELKFLIGIESSEDYYYSGKLFPYFKVDKNYYFYKEELDRWLTAATAEQREYDTKQGYRVD